ncbi:MAG: PAS domain S-box protein [Deltaproteobacteria bacterium]|nr:PAS domain S-box protein [Deltaproteobacteria bacterium]
MPLKNKKHYGKPFRPGASSRSIRAWSTRDSIFLLSVLAYIASFIIMYKWKNFGMGITAFIPVITAAWVYGAAAGCAAGLLSLAANIGICQIMGIDWYVRIIKSGAGLQGTTAFIMIGFIIGHISDLSRKLKKELRHKELVERELDLHRRSLEKLVEAKTVELSAALQQLTAGNEDLASSEKRLRAVFETAIDAILTTNSRGEIISWNMAAESMYGYSSAEVLGRHVNMLIPERLHDSNNKGMGAALRQCENHTVYNRIEGTGLRKDGSEFPTEVSQSVWKAGDEVFATGIIRDITERRHAERSLQESEARLRAVFDGAVDAIVTTNSNGQIVNWNKAAEGMFGYTAEEIIGRQVNVLIPERVHFPDSQAWRRAVLHQADERIKFHRREAVCVRENGSEFPAEISQSLWKSGDEVFATAIIRDIAESKRSEKALLEREARLRSIFETAVDAIITVNNSGSIIDWNKAAEKIYGYTAEEIIGKPAQRLIPERLHGPDSQQMKNVMMQREEGIVFNRREGVGIRKDGSEFPTEVSQSVWKSGDEIFATGIVRDITERKKAEKTLREREERLRSIVETAVDAIITTDNTGTIVFWNHAAEKIFGYAEQEIVGKNAIMLLPERLHDELDALREAFFQNGVQTSSESIGLKKGGTEFPIEVSRAVWNSEGATFATAIVRDITQRKKTEHDRLLLSSVIEQAHENILIMDAQGTIVYVNPAVVSQMERPAHAILGANGFQATGSIYDLQFFKAIYELLQSGSAWSGVLNYQISGGKTASVEQTLSPVLDAEGRLTNILSISRDISHEKYLEEQLRQSQKMEAIGTLAGGIAHDFNNILAAILGYTELAMMDVPKDSITAGRLHHVISSCDRARSLVKQILTFSRKSPRKASPFRVSSIVKEVIKLLRASLPSTIDIRQDISDADAVVRADPTQLHQLIINLCTNAAQAMEESGGTLTISQASCVKTANDIKGWYDLPPGNYVRLTVRDTGPGIIPEIKDRIFEPFFTTKAVGKGTGMGLAVAHGIVKSCNGCIHVDSAPGAGAAFHVLLPRIDEKPPEAAVQQPAAVPRGSGAILFVDDEESVMQIAHNMLEALGYTVFSTSSSMQAFEMFTADPGRFDCVITDMTMPQIRGDELARRMLEVRPELPIILCTGFSEKISEEQALKMGIRAFLLKPFSMQNLGQTLQKALEAV